MKKIKLPSNVEYIIAELERAGYEAYAVGGCVRDRLLGRVPGDWDITTSARPEQVKAVFRRTIDTGIQHGTVTVLMPAEQARTMHADPAVTGATSGIPSDARREAPHVRHSGAAQAGRSAEHPGVKFASVWEGYEVTTYRIDGAYLDGRHPSAVQFTPSLHEDLARRDFTINAMAVNDRSGIVDDFGGLEDLGRRIVRAVGEPEQRFQEDALRMLRALRFSAQLGFDIDPATWQAVRKLAPNLQHVSKERIAVELTKLLMSDHPEHIALVSTSGLSEYISEHFADAFHDAIGAPEDYPVYPWMPSDLPAERYVRWGVFLRGVPDRARGILRELKMDNDTIAKAGTVAQLFLEPLPNSRYKIRKKLSEIGYETYENYLRSVACLLRAARDAEWMKPYLDAACPKPETVIMPCCQTATKPDSACSAPEKHEDRTAELLDRVRRVQFEVAAIRVAGDCIELKNLEISGQDLMAIGIPRGPEIGRTLHALLDQVLQDPSQNHRERLIELACRRMETL